MKKNNQANKGLQVMFVTLTSSVYAGSVAPILDGYAFELYSNVTIDINNHIITIDSNMQNCEQPNGSPPLEDNLYALHDSNYPNQFIGLSQITYNTSSGRLFFTSETSDLFCINGKYVDTIFANDFSDLVFANSFD
ncbi:MAG: hypothetical protein R3E90_00865 [Marinicella sp.]|nr:hypothetical protein [Xanthomonadales bacterium]